MARRLLTAVVVVVLAACTDGADDAATTTTAERTTTTAVGTVTARIVIPSAVLSAGATTDAEVVVENNTGSAFTVNECGPFIVALASETIQPNPAIPSCYSPMEIPVGESTHPTQVAATYLECSPYALPPGVTSCIVDGHLPPLPPGDYEARLYGSDEITTDWEPVAIRVA